MDALSARRWSAFAVAGFGFVVSFAMSWVPSLDFNEAATVVSALRPWSAFWTEIHTVDAVHATYYAFMHLWLGAFGYGAVPLRIPASIAAGLTSGLVVMLGTRLAGRRVGVTAGVIFAVLPITMWEGYWGREYELTTTLATGLVLVFLAARDRTLREERSWPWWLLFAALAAVSQYVFGYLIMLCIGLGGALAVSAIRRRWQALRALARFGLAVAAALAAWAPIALLEMREKAQVSWIPGLSANTITGVLDLQFFQGNAPLAVIGWSSVLVATIGGALAWRRHRTTGSLALIAVCLPWLVVPPAVLLVLTGVGAHVYVPRYVAFTAPAMALLMAAPVAWIRWRPRACTAGILVVLLAIAAPTWAAQRRPGAREADTWNTIAATVAAARKAEPAGSRDAVAFGAAHAHKVATSQVIADIYPKAFAGMRDVTLAVPYDKATGLWDLSKPFGRALPSAQGADFIWVLATVQSHQGPAAITILARDGYHVSRQWRFDGEQVLQFAKGAAAARRG